METDRRASSRILRRLRVLFGGDVVFTADVTANGMCIETSRLVNPGTSVSGTITVKDRDFQFTGMVCWARSEDPQHGRMGVRFLDVPFDFQAELESLH
jgi:PilZ domain-containing protein